MKSISLHFALYIVFVGIAAGALIGPARLAAQSDRCVADVTCSEYSIGGACYPTLPPGVFNCQSADWTTYCKVRTNACSPSAAASETGPGHPSCPACTGTQPINFTSGNTYIEQTDINIPGLGGGLKLVRFWNSLWPSSQSAYNVGLFGPNWRSNFEERVFVGGDGYIKYSRGDGSFWSFGYNNSNWLTAAPENEHASLTQNSTNWTITFKNGERRLFDINSGNLLSIIDRNGNTTQLSYDGTNRLTAVTDPASRHLYFTYANSSSWLITGVSSDVGLSLAYSYDGQSRLLQVTKPDQSTLNFQYGTNTNAIDIVAVTDSNGKILESHTYDSNGRGLTGSRANGVESVTVTY